MCHRAKPATGHCRSLAIPISGKGGQIAGARGASKGISRRRKPIEGSPGFTMLEVVIGLAIIGLLGGVLAAAISLILLQVPTSGARLAVEDRQQLARYWITQDANSAESFTPGASPQYGTFTWRDFSGEATSTHEAIYSYDSSLKALMREEKVGGVTQSTFQVATDILQESDVTVTWSPGQRKVTVTITPTIQGAPAVGDISRTATVVAFLRYRAEGFVSPPGVVPVPTPPPGSSVYYVDADPTICAGTWVSGNAASLHDADSNLYIVDSTVGNPKSVCWEVYSGTITAPVTINQIEIRFTGGKVSKNNIVLDFYVKGPSGYSTTPDSGFTFMQANVEYTHYFYLDAAKVSYVDGTRVVYLKLVTSSGAAFHTLYCDQITFIASP